MNGFEADPEGIIAKGNSIINIYNGYMAEKNNVSKTTDEIATAWEGADSAGYVSAIHGYDEDFKKLGEVLAQLGEILRRHGERLASSRDAIRSAASRL